VFNTLPDQIDALIDGGGLTDDHPGGWRQVVKDGCTRFVISGENGQETLHAGKAPAMLDALNHGGGGRSVPPVVLA